MYVRLSVCVCMCDMPIIIQTSYIGNNVERLTRLIDTHGIDINSYREPDTGLTLLLVRACITISGSMIFKSSFLLWSPQCACLSGKCDVVKLLLDKGSCYIGTW